MRHPNVTEPLGIDVDVPEERLVASLDLLVTINDWGSKKRAKGVRTRGHRRRLAERLRPRGSWRRHLILALGGRGAVRDQLSCDGVDQLGL